MGYVPNSSVKFQYIELHTSTLSFPDLKLEMKLMMSGLKENFSTYCLVLWLMLRGGNSGRDRQTSATAVLSVRRLNEPYYLKV